MNTFQKISIEVSRDHVGGTAFRARAVAEFSGSTKLTVEVALDANNNAAVWCDGPQQAATTLSIIESVLSASRMIAAG